MPDFDFQALLEQLSQADLPDADLYKLSNLHGDGLAGLTAMWASLPVERRQTLVARLVEIGEEDFEPDFTELFKLCLHDPDPKVRVSAMSVRRISHTPGIGSATTRVNRRDAC